MRLASSGFAVALWMALAVAGQAAAQAPRDGRGAPFPPPRPAAATRPASMPRTGQPMRDAAVRPATHEAPHVSAPRQAIAAPDQSAPTPLRLKPRHAAGQVEGQSGASDSPRSDGLSGSLVTMAASLALVMGLFFLIVVVLRRGMPKSMTRLPAEVLEPLGRSALGAKQQLHLVRCGRRLLLLAVTATGVETLTEITDPAEVDRLAGLCRQGAPHSSSAAFGDVLQQMSRETDGPGFVGRGTRSLELANRKN